MDPRVRSHGMKADPPGYLWSKYECFLMSGWWDIPHLRNFNVKLWSNSTNGTESRKHDSTNEHTNGRTERRKLYTPLHKCWGTIKLLEWSKSKAPPDNQQQNFPQCQPVHNLLLCHVTWSHCHVLHHVTPPFCCLPENNNAIMLQTATKRQHISLIFSFSVKSLSTQISRGLV